MAFVATRRALLGGGQRKWSPADWWTVAGQTCVAAYQPIGAPSLAASYVNLANPGTYDAAPGVAPTFDAATGWTFDGTTQWLNSQVVPVQNQTWSALARFSDRANDRGYLLGMRQRIGVNKYNQFLVSPSGVSSGNVLFANGGFVNYAPGMGTSGISGVAGNRVCIDGFFVGNVIPAGDAAEWTLSLLIGAYRNHTSSGGFNKFDGKIQAIAIYSTTLSASDVAALTARMQAL